MKNKILKTLFVFGLWSIPYSIISHGEQVARKYLALGQMENSEVNLQVYNAAQGLGYINYFTLVFAIAALVAIWKPKKAVEQ